MLLYDTLETTFAYCLLALAYPYFKGRKLPLLEVFDVSRNNFSRNIRIIRMDLIYIPYYSSRN